MKKPFRVYVGWDEAQAVACQTCIDSLARFIPYDWIVPIRTETLRLRGWYWREDDAGQSTEFTYSRFLTPAMSGFYGTSLFCDGDFFWRRDPRDLLAYQDEEKAVQVVRHHITPDQLSDLKMNGKKQIWYPKKNWSSLMLFNNAHLDCKNLVPENVSEESAEWLHQFHWTDIDFHRSLPSSFNYLAGYGYEDKDPHAVHFTDGGPWQAGYENVEYAAEWRKFRGTQESF